MLLTYIYGRLIITPKIIPFSLLIPGSSRLIHRLWWFKTRLKPSSRKMRANYHFKSGKRRVNLSQWRPKHVRWNGNWIRIQQRHHLRVLLRVSRMGLWIKWGLFRSLQPSWGWERSQLWRYEMKFYFVDVIHVYEGREGYFIKSFMHFWHSWYWTGWQTSEDRLLVTF